MTHTLINTILISVGIGLLITILILVIYLKKKSSYWKNENAAYTHTEAIMSAIDEVPETIIVLNKESLIIYANSTSEQMFGYKEKDLLEKPIYFLIPNTLAPIVEQAKKDNHRDSMDITAKNRLLKDLYLELTISAKVNSSVSTAYTFIFKDVSHRKSNELNKAQLMDAYTKSCELVIMGEEIMKSGSWCWNLPKDEVTFSLNFAKIFGIPSLGPQPAAFLIGIIYQEDREIVNNQLVKAMETREPYEIEYRVMKRNGSKDLVRALGRPILNENNVMTKLLGTVQIIKFNV